MKEYKISENDVVKGEERSRFLGTTSRHKNVKLYTLFKTGVPENDALSG